MRKVWRSFLIYWGLSGAKKSAILVEIEKCSTLSIYFQNRPFIRSPGKGGPSGLGDVLHGWLAPADLEDLSALANKEYAFLKTNNSQVPVSAKWPWHQPFIVLTFVFSIFSWSHPWKGRRPNEPSRPRGLRSEVNSELNFSPNFEGLVLGCIDADFCK